MPLRIPRRVVLYLRRRKVTLSFLTVVAVSVIVLGVMGTAIKGNHDQGARLRAQAREIKEQTARTTAALCALREDIERRREADIVALAAGRQFLREHPDGIPGIPVKLLRDSVKARETTVRNESASIEALSIVMCKTKENS